jgi:hypothetical protein
MEKEKEKTTLNTLVGPHHPLYEAHDVQGAMATSTGMIVARITTTPAGRQVHPNYPQSRISSHQWHAIAARDCCG